ncbi:hypothetical protein SJI00_20835 [Pseudomonas sp. RP23018S]|uniref:hypothetical protein n=1 Tax=Pseudomonas sp. RP23018S TaxID=3096037 RepID=UPI002ACAD3CF|nr:hypothetical protein [Pseudomonas sp. RP23018S]MDZ5605222.1 hypothetical protein [Pseudomonas sp. RP23018S]
MIDQSIVVAADALSSLVDSLNNCKRAILKPGSLGQCVFFDSIGGTIEGDSAELLIKALTDWEVMEGCISGSVPRHIGLVEAGSTVIFALQGLNDAKHAFKKAVSTIAAKDSKERQKLARGILTKQGMARAHPIQCWREIKLFLGAPVNTAGFTTAKKSFSSRTLSVQDAIAELARRESHKEVEEIESARLAGCESVRWVEPVAEFTRVNLSYLDADGNRSNATFHASMPVIIEKSTWPKKLKFNLPKEVSRNSHGKIAGELIVDLPFRKGAYLAIS